LPEEKATDEIYYFKLILLKLLIAAVSGWVILNLL